MRPYPNLPLPVQPFTITKIPEYEYKTVRIVDEGQELEKEIECLNKLYEKGWVPLREVSVGGLEVSKVHDTSLYYRPMCFMILQRDKSNE